jgi:GH25 family lysozyme M1 (1,4-beta-N-acetylmuramidase)
MTAAIRLPDISEFQGFVAHQALVDGCRAEYGAAIVIARVCYGAGHVDDQADRNIDGLRAAGVDALGLYAYLVAGQDPVVQADTFCRVIQAHGGLRRNEFIVCDDEEGSGDQSGRVDAFLERANAVLQASASQDMWYSGLYFALAHHLEAARGHRWIASYGTAEPIAVSHDLWQYADAASFPGVSGPCDASVFHGSLADFLAIIGDTPTPAPPPPDEEDDMSGRIAFVYVPLPLGLQYDIRVDNEGRLMLGYWDHRTGVRTQPLALVDGLVPAGDVTGRYIAEADQVHLYAERADGSTQHSYTQPGGPWFHEVIGAADGPAPTLVDIDELVGKLATALAPQLQQVDEAKLAADLAAQLPGANAAEIARRLANG